MDSDRCQLLGGIFATAIQVFLGIVAIGTLLYKRALEDQHTRRPYEIWLLDVSKQCLANVVIHFSNIGLSILFAKLSIESGKDIQSDECAFYFISNVLDTCIGIFLLWFMLRAVKAYAERHNIYSIRDQGYYGFPPEMTWYFYQLVCYLGIVLLAKGIIGLFMLGNKDSVSRLGSSLFEPILQAFGPKYELIVVMILTPCFLNIIQFWIQDNILDGSSIARKDYQIIGKNFKDLPYYHTMCTFSSEPYHHCRYSRSLFTSI
jgi:hypothetical protein